MQSLKRAIEILEALKEPEGSFSINEISKKVNLPPSTVHRILNTLCEKNYVLRDERTHLYQLGPALISLGMAAKRNIRLQSIASPFVHKLSELTGEDAFLVVPAGYKGYVLEKAEGPNTLKVVEKFGYELDLHCGAIRKVLLAYQPKSFIEQYIQHGLVRYTEFTVTDPDVLLADLEKIRREGIAVSKNEYVEGGLGIGAPVFDSSGEIVASIGIIAPVSNVDEERVEELKEKVKQCAKELSQYLGYDESVVKK